MQTQRTKDPIVNFKSVMQSVNDEGKKRVTLYLSQEEATNLASTITSMLENERGVKLDVHIKKKTVEETGRTFDSAFAFVKPVQDPAAFQAGGNRTFQKKSREEVDRDVTAKIEALKAKQLKQ